MVKRLAGIGALAAGAVLWCGAQEMGLTIKTPNTVYLVGEPVVADVRIHNRTTQALLIQKGSQDAQMELMVVRSESGLPVEPFDAQASLAETTVKSSDAWEGTIDVSRFFPLRAPGRYLVRLVVVHRGVRYESFPRAFDVVPGLELTKVVQMFPGDQPVQRQMRLTYWVRNQMEELFLQVSEQPEIRTWRTYSLGPLLRTTDPKVDIAPDGVLTVVHRATPDVFVKTQVRSEAGTVTFLGQEKLLDPVASASKRMLPFQKMAMEDALEKRDNEKKKGGWWPF